MKVFQNVGEGGSFYSVLPGELETLFKKGRNQEIIITSSSLHNIYYRKLVQDL